LLPNGTRLGPYEIVGAIGAGGSEVYAARDTRPDRDVAIKVLALPAVDTDPLLASVRGTPEFAAYRKSAEACHAHFLAAR
jgi:hypothetical protein